MDVREAGRLGALKANKVITTEMRRAAALKGWEGIRAKKKIKKTKKKA